MAKERIILRNNFNVKDDLNLNKNYTSIIITLLLLPLFNLTVFANSSWIWISETRPYDILPWVAIGTLIIETVSIVFFSKIKNKRKVFTFVTVANALSFSLPYLVNFISYSHQLFSFDKYLEYWPSYTVGALFCFATIIIELPIVYFSLKKYTEYNKKLLITIISSNVITTILVAIIERILCVGRW